MKKERILIKISGESFASGENKFDINKIESYATQIKKLSESGLEVAIVVGGGNLWRGTLGPEVGIDRSAADYTGMIATVMNGLILQQVLEAKYEVPTRVMSAIEINKVCEPYIKRKALRHLEKGRVIIFVGGTGNPYFTTDTASALKACEIGASKILMAKNGVDGVYDKDPNVHREATRFEKLTYKEVFDKDIRIMDKTATTMCAENNVSLYIFSAQEENSIVKVLNKEINFTEITN